ncbi:SOS response-associated peptidase family protein [Mesorhizobium sp. M0185]|uniref:SOS response-associated peptidase family protein n=1 Tax=unclassified Mesorhizobium TaxID=325217 RepID=UPI003338D473
MAALWENWRDPAIGGNIRFTVLTCEPNPLMATFHNRVPVILAPEEYMIWLTDPEPEHLMKAFPEELRPCGSLAATSATRETAAQFNLGAVRNELQHALRQAAKKHRIGFKPIRRSIQWSSDQSAA